MKLARLLRIIFSIALVWIGMGATLFGAALAHAGVETAKEVALAVTGAKAVKLAGKALKLAKASTVVGKVGDKVAAVLPEAVKTTVQQAGTLVKKGANAVGKLDCKLDTAVSTQVQKLRGRGATAGAGQNMGKTHPLPQNSAQCVYSKDVKGWKRPYKDSHDISAKDPNAQDFLKRKFQALQGAQQDAVEVRTLPDGRIRYHEIERASDTLGRTRGHAFTTEYDPKTGRVRTWDEGRDHSGNVIRVRPKMIDGMTLDAPHYPPTKADHEKYRIKKPKQPTEPKGDS